MEEVGDAEKYSFGIFYNNMRVYVERMPGNPKIITSMQVYDALNNKSATVDLLEPILEENHEGKRSVCTRLVEMTGRTRQNTDYKLEKYGNGAITVSDRKGSYCMSQFSQASLGSDNNGETEDFVSRKSIMASKATFDGPSGGLAAIIAGDDGSSALSSQSSPSYGISQVERVDEEDVNTAHGSEKEGSTASLSSPSYGNKTGKDMPMKAGANKSKNVPVRTRKKALYVSGKKQQV